MEVIEVAINIDEQLVYEMYTILKERFDLKDDISKYIALQLPRTINDLYMVPSFGPAKLKKIGTKVLKSIAKFVRDNNLEYNSPDEAYGIFFDLDDTNVGYIDTDKISDIVKYAKDHLEFPNELTSKNIISYMANEGFIQLEYGIIEDVTSLGMEYEIEIAGYYNGVANVRYGKRILEYLFENLYKIYAFSFGRSPFSYLYDDIDTILEEQQKLQKKYFFIFDFDQTIFDTDMFRIRRRKMDFDLSDEEIEDISFIEGFENLFLNKNSRFSLDKNDAIILTNSNLNCARKILEKKKKQYSILKIVKLLPQHGKIHYIKSYIEEFNINKEDIIAFGDDEKDALTYSICGIPYYIVSNYYGYDGQVDLLKNVVFPKSDDFRNAFLYDIIKVNAYNKFNNIESKYFDDIIVYFRRYYDKKNYVDNVWSPEFDNRHFLHKLTYFSFGQDKQAYLRNHANELVLNDYNNLKLKKNIIFAKVPGSKEITYDDKLPCSILIDRLSIQYGNERNYADLLIRNSKVQTSHGGGTKLSSKEHYDTITVTKDIRGKEIYLFDDVITTGSQMMACVERLYEAGASHVVCFAIAKTCPMNNPIIDIYGNKRWE